MERSGKLYCLGDIVHNNVEVERLRSKGLQIINHDDLKNLRDCKVLIRAHGEPPATYQIALQNNIELIDASCPVVLKLQNRVRESYDDIEEDHGQIVIYGEAGHAEVNGLIGQTNAEAITVKTEEEWNRLHLFLLSIVKTSRYANNYLKGGHADSVLDNIVYLAMLHEIDDKAVCEKFLSKVNEDEKA